MSSNFIFDLAPTSNFNLSFLMDIGNTHWYSNGEKQKKDFLCKQLKQELPKNSIFNISSLVFNFKTKEQEVLSSYSCFFQPMNESLCIILEANANHANFTRECMTNFMDFAEKTGIKLIYLLLSLAVLGLHYCTGFSLVAGSGGYSPVVGMGFLVQWLLLL